MAMISRIMIVAETLGGITILHTADISEYFPGKLFKISQVLSQDTDNDFRVDAGIVMDNDIPELSHLVHYRLGGFGNNAILE